jgi:signal peptidase I
MLNSYEYFCSKVIDLDMLNLLAQSAPTGGLWAFIDKVARTPLSVVLMFVVVCTVLRVAIHPYMLRVPPHRRSGLFTKVRALNEVLDALVYAGVFVFMLIRPFGVQVFQIPSGSMIPELKEGDFILANKAIYRYSEPVRGDIIVFRPPDRAKHQGQGEVDFIKRMIGAPGDVIEIRGGQLYRNDERVEEPYKNNPGQAQNYDWKLVKYEGSYGPWQGKFIPVMMVDSNYGKVANWGTGTAWEYAIGTIAEKTGQSNASFIDFLLVEDAEVERMNELLEAPPAAVPAGFYLMFGDNRMNSYDSRGWGLVAREDLVGRSEYIWAPISRWGKTR